MVTKKGNAYYRAKRLDADGKWIDVYGKSPEDLNEKLILAEKKINEARLRLQNPTVEEYSLKWLKMHSVHISAVTLRRYTHEVKED